jgi:Fe-S cluster biosynthesis and repair protein YggX
MPFRPFQNDLGLRVFEQICNNCWSEWLKLQQQAINHYGLNVRDQEAKKFLTAQMEGFLFPPRQKLDT